MTSRKRSRDVEVIEILDSDSDVENPVEIRQQPLQPAARTTPNVFELCKGNVQTSNTVAPPKSNLKVQSPRKSALARPSVRKARAEQSTQPAKNVGAPSMRHQLSLLLSQPSATPSETPIPKLNPASKPPPYPIATLPYSSRIEAARAPAQPLLPGLLPDLSGSQSTQAGSRVEPGLKPVQAWVDKHCPVLETDLAVAHKKVFELKDWLEGRFEMSSASRARLGCCGSMLILTGPAGCGKSTTVQVLARCLQASILEWQAPTPTLWSERTYQADNSLPYVSKMDAFDAFVARAKYPVLAALSVSRVGGPAAASQSQLPSPATSSLNLSQTQAAAAVPGGGNGRRILLLDDLPYAHNAETRMRLLEKLQELGRTARCPVVVIMTEGNSRGSGDQDGGGGGGGGGSTGLGALHKLLPTLEAAGAVTLAFNPVTVTNISKALMRISAAEGVDLPKELCASLAEAADGDVRSAVQNLQLVLQGECGAAAQQAAAPGGRDKPPAKRGSGSRRKAGGSSMSQQQLSRLTEVCQAVTGHKDASLNLFHFLGKILYNKRDGAPDDPMASPDAPRPSTQRGRSKARSTASSSSSQAAAGQGAGRGVMGLACPSPPLQPQYQRPPMRYDVEQILEQSGLDAGGVALFLHENYLHFMSDQATEDVDAAAYYLSTAGWLSAYHGSSSSWGSHQAAWLEDDSLGATLAGASAASVAARGLMYANCQPAARRFAQMHKPASVLVDKAAGGNGLQLAQASTGRVRLPEAGAGCYSSTRAVAAWELPWLDILARAPSHAWLAPALPLRWSYVWDGKVSDKQRRPQGIWAGPGAQGAVDSSTGLDDLATLSLGFDDTERERQGGGGLADDPIEEDMY